MKLGGVMWGVLLGGMLGSAVVAHSVPWALAFVAATVCVIGFAHLITRR